MAGAAIVRHMCEVKNVSLKDLSKMMQCPYQSLRNKLYRDTFPFKEVEHIADLLGFDIVAVMKEAEQAEGSNDNSV